MKMDKIKEAFEKAFNLTEEYLIDTQEERAFILGFKAANSLPTEKICPVCNGKGYLVPDENDYAEDCLNKNCKDGIVQIYYTPKEYKEITGENYPDDTLVWIRYESASDLAFIPLKYLAVKNSDDYDIYIIQTAQPAPEADYRRKE